jgi:hypothetical protein
MGTVIVDDEEYAFTSHWLYRTSLWMSFVTNTIAVPSFLLPDLVLVLPGEDIRGGKAYRIRTHRRLPPLIRLVATRVVTVADTSLMARGLFRKDSRVSFRIGDVS